MNKTHKMVLCENKCIKQGFLQIRLVNKILMLEREKLVEVVNFYLLTLL